MDEKNSFTNRSGIFLLCTPSLACHWIVTNGLNMKRTRVKHGPSYGELLSS
ncbi:hypothetical protein JCM19039_3236 [Geomicrobium sp. JCM 19039]|nr:hypothetical protein JCM19039_3236 [Geomicrobium sp. JCM 19039]